jgi:hypothetical protein
VTSLHRNHTHVLQTVARSNPTHLFGTGISEAVTNVQETAVTERVQLLHKRMGITDMARYVDFSMIDLLL